MIPADANGSREEGGVTLFQPGGEKMFIYDAAMKYMPRARPPSSSAARSTAPARAATGRPRARSCSASRRWWRRAERIHRSNLVGMGVAAAVQARRFVESLRHQGDETFDVVIVADLRPQQDATLVIHSADGSSRSVQLTLRIDTPIEVDYYRHGGILPFVLRQLLAA
jgi:aconitate hydratase